MRLWPALWPGMVAEFSIKQFGMLLKPNHMRGCISPILFLIALCLPAFAQKHSGVSSDQGQPAAIWEDPGNISSKDLFAGPGGAKDRPQPPFKFLKEDKHGQNSKIDVADSHGDKWRAKLGIEAQPETVASRLLWAVGFFTNENYFYPELTVQGLPTHLHRGQGHVISPGHIEGVRLQRHAREEKKSSRWNWQHNHFAGTRELNGLRVMMALIGNWDLKDENNAIVVADKQEKWLVTDVGTAFGPQGMQITERASKNNLKAYQRARFIKKITPEYVDFNLPQRPPLIFLFVLPTFVHQLCMRSVGNHVPRKDAKWVGSLLAQLSERQIQDAFRAGGYTPEQARAYSKAVQSRIAQLNSL
jgi:hypothetical protein